MQTMLLETFVQRSRLDVVQPFAYLDRDTASRSEKVDARQSTSLRTTETR
ncbi:hypothetical protein OESDEN_18424 [Oesophagostomum dentatum]|uniref:Uncharacterized protein n=1 Tax=Oesophagostomum dentatum TaxID=61180 RepID=A0A0B1SEB0_OESDE|nr:hypothetical protein OESDEN_18424 [Oesophagostomum dentatum]